MSGSLPEAIGLLKKLDGIDLSKARFSGSLPKAIGELGERRASDAS